MSGDLESNSTPIRADADGAWFTPARFGLFLGLFIAVAHFSVVIGRGTWFHFDYGVLGYPFAHYQRECFWRGELPLWNPLSNCGAPFLAQWGTMALYPGALIYLLLPMPWSLGIFCLLHLFLGGLGMYFLARRWTGHSFAAAVAGFLFVFNGVTLSSLCWPNYTVALGWMPWLVLAAEQAGREGGRALILAALAGAMQMLSGAPEIILLTWLVVLAMLVHDVRDRPVKWPAAAGRFTVLIFLVAALSAAQLLPFFDLLAHSQRDANFATAKWAMPGWGWANFIVPLFHYFMTPQGAFVQEQQFFLASYYLGLTAVGLAALAVVKVRERRVLLLAGVALLGLILALGENGYLYPLLRRVFPPIGVARYLIKCVVLTAFAVPLLAAYGVRWFQKNDGDGARIKWPALVSIWILFVLFAGIILWFAQQYPFPYDQLAVTRTNAMWRIALLSAALAALFGASAPMDIKWRPALRFSLLLCLGLDALTHLPRLNPVTPAGDFTSGAARETLHLQPSPAPGVARVFITPFAEEPLLRSEVPDARKDFLFKRLALWSNLNLLDDIPKVNGSSTLQLREQAEVQKILYASPTNHFPRLLDFLAVSHMTAPGQVNLWTNRSTALPWINAGAQPRFATSEDILRRLFQPDFNPRATVFLPDTAAPVLRATNPSDARVIVNSFSAQRVEVEVETAVSAILTVAQSHAPGWRAEVDGQAAPIWRANHAFQAVEIPPGHHRVVLSYHERLLPWGALISGLALLGCALGWKHGSRTQTAENRGAQAAAS